ncbi:hypothetical protein CAL12_00095 [Bordetella genomosp. 8]|uniref:SnoaL-like domain-containing protein n=1 Tax=Bordetella genomosp. 8 TaxID=1416806 RepID=A0A1W6YE68_9BORD|nr:nuclear transport factor 2 family protein [Bordetella genomosp. 8]ARP79376.1 hypothetical protein CAL12_00095 [Bordetella genomosp. 8]
MNDTISLCRNQVMGFFRDLDDKSYDSLVGRMTPDGIWHRQGKVLNGREDVMRAMSARSPTMRIHHLISNLYADRADERRCVMRGYMLVVRHEAGRPLQGPAPLDGIENIRTTHIELVRVDGAWLIAVMRNDEPSFAIQA